MNKRTQIRLLLFSLLLFFTTTISAQNFYLKASTGYNIPTKLGSLNQIEQTSNFNGSTNFKKLKIGYSQGLNFSLNIGYNLNQYLGFELRANHLLGSPSEVIFNRRTESIDFFELQNVTQEFQANVTQAGFLVVLKHPTPTKFHPYIQVGGVLSNAIFETSHDSYFEFSSFGTDFISETQTVLRTFGGVGFGLLTAIGGNYKINKSLSVFADATLLTMSYAPKRLETISHLRDGISDLSNLTVFQKEGIYTDEFDTNFNQPTNENKPRELLKTYIPLSNVSFNIGLQINL